MDAVPRLHRSNGDIDAFIREKRDALVADVNAMYEALGRSGKATAGVIDRVTESLKERLTRAQSANFMPQLTYSMITFTHSADNAWASPWGQAYALLNDIATFPRKALTDGFFFRGLNVKEDDLLNAMNVADDALLRGEMARGIKDRCRADLNALVRIEKAPLDVREKCDCVRALLNGDTVDLIARSGV